MTGLFKYLFLVVLFLSSAGQMASDVYLPSLPAIANYLHSNVSYIQLSVSIYMIGYACAQVVYGPVSDGVGRKKPLILGLIILTLGGIVCLNANSVRMLILGRFLQGIGAAGAVAIGRVLLFDVYSGPKLIKLNSYLSMAVVGVVAAAPLIGGYIQEHSRWEMNFLFLTVFSVGTLLLCLLLLPETHATRDIDHIKLGKMLGNVKRLFLSPLFVGCCFILLLTYGGIIAWLVSGPVLIQERLHYSPAFFGWVAFSGGLCYVIGAWVNGRLVDKISTNSLIATGMVGMMLAAISMLVMAMIAFNFWVIILPVGLFIGSSSMVFNNIYVMGIRAFDDIVGMAGSILGCVQTLGGSLAGMLVSGLHERTQMPLALILIGCVFFCVFLFFVAIKPMSVRSQI